MLGFIFPILTILAGGAMCFINPIGGVPMILTGVLWLLTKTTFFSIGIIVNNLKIIIPLALIAAGVFFAKEQGYLGGL